MGRNTDIEYSDNMETINVPKGDTNQPPITKGLPSKFMFRGMRSQRQYDVPQIGKSVHFSSSSYKIDRQVAMTAHAMPLSAINAVQMVLLTRFSIVE